MPYRRTAVLAALFSLGFTVACAPLTPQRSLDRKPPAEREAAARIPVFQTGAAAPPTALAVLGPVEAHSCQFWEFADPASVDDAIARLQFAALEAGADGLIEVSHGKDEGNRWASRCWDSYVARGTAVKLGSPSPTATVTATPAAIAASAPTQKAAAATADAGTATTIVASGSGRPELMDWIQRLSIPRGSFIARGPGDGNLDWLGSEAEIGDWQVQLPRSGAAGRKSGARLSDGGLALEPGVSRLSLSARQLGYRMSATWTYSEAGRWEMADQLVQRLP